MGPWAPWSPWAHGALDPLPGPHGFLHKMGPYTKWVPTQNGSLHILLRGSIKFKPLRYTIWVSTQYKIVYNVG